MKKGRTVGSRNGVYTTRRSREEAETLFLENMKLVPFVIKKMEIDYTDDAMQEGYIGLWLAALCFDDSIGKKFSSYAFQAIRGQIVREYQGRKKSVQPEISLDFLSGSEGAWNVDGRQFHEAIEDAGASRIFSDIEVGVYLEQKLNELELRLTELKLAGFSSREISEYFGKSRVWADNKVKEIRGKLQEITQEKERDHQKGEEMSQAVMISIQPKWCALIASGKKTVEVRKTAPNLEVPFKCYIYQTKGAKENPVVTNDFGHTFHILELGQVIGEFVCDKVTWHGGSDFIARKDCERAIEGSCVSRSELFSYLGIVPETSAFDRRCDFYCWHISDLYIYDIPKRLSDFKAYRREHRIVTARFQEGDCELVKTVAVLKPIDKAPQSWCYCQELKDAD